MQINDLLSEERERWRGVGEGSARGDSVSLFLSLFEMCKKFHRIGCNRQQQLQCQLIQKISDLPADQKCWINVAARIDGDNGDIWFGSDKCCSSRRLKISKSTVSDPLWFRILCSLLEQLITIKIDKDSSTRASNTDPPNDSEAL